MAVFKTQLPAPVELAENWIVALSEISFPSIIKNVTEGVVSFRQHNEARRSWKFATKRVKTGFYKNVDLLMQEIGQVTFGSSYADVFSWSVDTTTQLLCVNLPSKSFISLKSQDLCDILGFKKYNQSWVGPTGPENTIQSDFPVDVYGGRHSMYVYCDLLGNEILGDKNTQLLRVVPISSMEGTMSSATTYFPITNLQFKTIEKKYFNNVQIKLCDETGSVIPFLGIGRTNITLLFKKIIQ